MALAHSPGAERPERAETTNEPQGRSLQEYATGYVLPLLAVACSLLLWWHSVRVIDITRIGDYGLLPLLPVTYFMAIGFIVVSFLFSLSRKTQHPWILGSHIVALIFVLHGTAPSVFSAVRYAWTYKHFGVVSYITQHGSVDQTVDIYHNWPGFFAGAAFLSQLMGIPADQWAGWSQVFFNLTYFIELAFLFQVLGIAYRVQWLAILLFVCGNWVGQDYFAPQAFSFTLSLAILAVSLSWLRRDIAGPFARIAGKLFYNKHKLRVQEDGSDLHRRRFLLSERAPYAYSGHRRTPFLIVIGLFSVMVVSHQLSPYMILLSLCGLVVFGGLRPFWLLGVLAAIALGFLGIHYTFIVDHFGPLLGGGVAQNAAARPTVTHPDQAVSFVSTAARILTFGIWILGVIGFLRQPRGQRSVLVGVMALAPFAFLGGQSYGGEAIYRVYLFSLPWFALMAAAGIVGKRITFSPRAVIIQTVTVFALISLFLVSYFGLEQINMVRSTEIAAMNTFYEQAPRGSLLLATEQGLPIRSSGDYAYAAKAGNADLAPALANDPKFNDHVLGKSDIPAINEIVDGYNRPAFMVFSTSAIVYAHSYGQMPDGSIENLEGAISTDPGWKLWYSNPDARIYQRITPAS